MLKLGIESVILEASCQRASAIKNNKQIAHAQAAVRQQQCKWTWAQTHQWAHAQGIANVACPHLAGLWPHEHTLVRGATCARRGPQCLPWVLSAPRGTQRLIGTNGLCVRQSSAARCRCRTVSCRNLTTLSSACT